MMKVGFIGAGHMGSAMMNYMAKGAALYVYDIAPEAVDKAHKLYGANITESISELVSKSDTVVVAIKPQFLYTILDELKGIWQSNKVLLSIVAGVSIAEWEDILGDNTMIARVMPNTPAMVGEAMNTVCFSRAMQNQESILELLAYTGKVRVIREEQMAAATAVAGCGPAYVYMMIESLADAGVAGGLFRAEAYELAAQTVLGAAKMVLETGQHPAELKDDVCSPGGVTIKGVMALEQQGFRAAVESAVQAAMGAKGGNR